MERLHSLFFSFLLLLMLFGIVQAQDKRSPESMCNYLIEEAKKQELQSDELDKVVNRAKEAVKTYSKFFKQYSEEKDQLEKEIASLKKLWPKEPNRWQKQQDRLIQVEKWRTKAKNDLGAANNTLRDYIEKQKQANVRWLQILEEAAKYCKGSQANEFKNVKNRIESKRKK